MAMRSDPEGARLTRADRLAHDYRISTGLEEDKDVARIPLRVHLNDARLETDKKAVQIAMAYLANPDEFGGGVFIAMKSHIRRTMENDRIFMLTRFFPSGGSAYPWFRPRLRLP